MLCPYCVPSPGMRPPRVSHPELMARGSALPSRVRQGKEGPERGRDLVTLGT